MSSNKTIGENIKKYRMASGLTQLELASQIFVDHSIVSRMERGLVPIDAGRLEQIARILKITVSDLYASEPIPFTKRFSDLIPIIDIHHLRLFDMVVLVVILVLSTVLMMTHVVPLTWNSLIVIIQFTILLLLIANGVSQINQFVYKPTDESKQITLTFPAAKKRVKGTIVFYLSFSFFARFMVYIFLYGMIQTYDGSATASLEVAPYVLIDLLLFPMTTYYLITSPVFNEVVINRSKSKRFALVPLLMVVLYSAFLTVLVSAYLMIIPIISTMGIIAGAFAIIALLDSIIAFSYYIDRLKQLKD